MTVLAGMRDFVLDGNVHPGVSLMVGPERSVVQVGLVSEQLHAVTPGGTGRYVSDLLVALNSTRTTSDGVVPWSAWHQHREALHVPGERRLPLAPRLLAQAWARGTGPVPRGVDVVHAPTLLAPPRRREPLVVTIHDAVPWTHPETLTPHGVRWHRRMAERVSREADAIITPSRAVAAVLPRFLPSLDAHRLVVIPNAMSPARADRLRDPEPDEADRKARLRLPDQGYLMFVGTREPRKGLDVLCQALTERPCPELPLVLVGPTGWGTVELPVPPGRVRVLGRLDEADLGVVYRHATALVLPSRAEGFGYPVLEAMAAGTPVLTSDDPALVETGGGATLCSPVGDPQALARALREVAGDAGLRAELIRRGRLRAVDFDSAVVGRRLWQLYSGRCDGTWRPGKPAGGSTPGKTTRPS